MTEQGTALEVRGEVSLSAPLEVSQANIDILVRNVKMLEKAVNLVWEEGIHFGSIPGVPGLHLFEPGAAVARDLYNVYPRRRILSERVKDGLITIIMEIDLIERTSDRIVATGVGACSMEETKYKYRWVDNPEDFDYPREGCKKRKNKYSGDIEYRVLNPEIGELMNTVVKMTSKRGEVDSAQALPGVSTVLARKRNEREDPSQRSRNRSRDSQRAFGPSRQQERHEDQWSRFWGQCRQMGLSTDEVHGKLNVASMLDDWVGKGKTLDDALVALREQLSKEGDPIEAWDEIRRLLPDTFAEGKSFLSESQIVDWFQNTYGLSVTVGDFRFQDPPAQLKTTHIVGFLKFLKGISLPPLTIPLT